jgi:hypothetical protein
MGEIQKRYNAFTWGLPHPSCTLTLLKRIVAEDKNSSFDAALEQLKVLIPDEQKKSAKKATDDKIEVVARPTRPAPKIEKKDVLHEEERKKLIDEL